MPSAPHTRPRSFIDVPADSDFPLENLPYGVFTPRPSDPPRVGVAIGNHVLDLSALETAGLLPAISTDAHPVFARPHLNDFMALGPAAWSAVRTRLTELLRADVPTLRDDTALRAAAFHPAADVQMCLPCTIGDYTDFYCSEAHARHVGRILRGPDAELPPSFKHMPIGYHGRVSSIVPSGTPIRRPTGQFLPPGADAPIFGPTQQLDFELEMGVLIGPGNTWQHPIPVTHAARHIFGLVLLNDWSARDIQAWEYRPLGPFLGKNFATTLGVWVVPLAALAPFRCPAPPKDVPPLPYLHESGDTTYDIHCEITLHPAGSPTAETISRPPFADLYWSLSQMIAHHTIGGCNLRPGDLLATGTISGTAPRTQGCLLELTRRGAAPLALSTGHSRSFLHDADTIALNAHCQAPDHRIGFGPCTATILPASP